MSITYVAPTGSPIQGTMQHDNATRWVSWGTRGDAVELFDYPALSEGEPEADWNPVTVADSALFVDYAGEMWLAHHLLRAIPGEEDATVALPHATTTLFQRELALGEAWEAAKTATAAAERALTLVSETVDRGTFITLDVVRDTLRQAEGTAARCYAQAKRASRNAMLESL